MTDDDDLPPPIRELHRMLRLVARMTLDQLALVQAELTRLQAEWAAAPEGQAAAARQARELAELERLYRLPD